MNADNNKLFTPVTIKNFTFKNRIGVAPMTRISADKASIPRQDVFDFLIRRAKNGAGLVYTEAIVTDYESAQGYLINQFLSSYSNKRTDAYGGALENRFRFAREVIQAVKAVIPDDRLLIFRISNWGIADMSVSLFSGSDEWQNLIRMLSAQPIDALSVSTYNFADKAFGTNRNMAQLTREVTDLPLLICGKIHDRKTADQAVLDADIALSAKSMLLNPNLVEEIRDGRDLPLYSSEEANRAYTGEELS